MSSSDLIAAVPRVGAVLIADTDNVSPSTSVSLSITSMFCVGESSSIASGSSSFATGASFTALMVMVTVPSSDRVPSDAV